MNMMARKTICARPLTIGFRPLTGEEKELVLLFGKSVSVYDILLSFSRDKLRFLPRCLSYKIQAKKDKMINPGGISIYNYMDSNNKILKSQVVEKTTCPFCLMKCGSVVGLRHHLASSHALFDINFRLSENGHRHFDVSAKPDAYKNGVLNYDLEKHHLVNYIFYRSGSRMRGQIYGPKERKSCKIFEMYSDYVPRDNANELPHVNGDIISSSLARTHLSETSSDIQTITQLEIGQSSRAKGHRAQGVQAERTDLLKSRQFYHSRTLQPMTLEEVISDADSDNEADEDFKDLQERLRLDLSVDASDEEKRFKWIWNTFVERNSVLTDKQVPWACEEFVKLHAKELLMPKLRWQWTTFAIDILWEYGLICAKTIDNCSIILQNAKEEEDAAALAAAETMASIATVAAAEVAEVAAVAAAVAGPGDVAAEVAGPGDAAAASTSKRTSNTENHKMMKKQKQNEQEPAAAATTEANANGNEPQPMELDEEEK